MGSYYYYVRVITAVGGGVIRDVLAGKSAVVIFMLQRPAGSVTLYVLVICELTPVDVAALISFFTTVSSRVVAIKAKLNYAA